MFRLQTKMYIYIYIYQKIKKKDLMILQYSRRQITNMKMKTNVSKEIVEQSCYMYLIKLNNELQFLKVTQIKTKKYTF